MKKITVYCASSSQISPVYMEQAVLLGALMASRGLTCINGGGNKGLMSTISDAVLAANGKVTGVIPQFMLDEGWFHPNLTELIVTKDMHTRKQIMAQKSDGCIALPGGIGTMEELLEIITWKQLGLYDCPIVILNINNYYDDLLKMLEKAVKENFMHLEHQRIYEVAVSVEEALNVIESGKKWIDNPRSIAAL